jgi:hypothetical protein
VYTNIYLSLDFSHKVSTKRCWKHKYVDSVFSKLSHWVIGIFYSITNYTIFSTKILEGDT